MGSNNIFAASLSGLNAAMYELNTTQHNIANANTPGYTRQQVVLGTPDAQATGSGFVGQGVNVVTVKRLYDQFLTTQVLQQQNQSSYLNTYLASMTQVDNLVSNTTSGVSNAMQGVFDAVNGLANTPTSVPARQTVLSSAQAAVDSFQSVSLGLTTMSSALNGQISNSVNQINTYAAQIATLNAGITTAMATNNGQPPNDLLDQRDQLVSQLNQQVGVTTQQQPDGSMNVFVGSGQALVVGNQSMSLQTVQSPNDPSCVNVAYLTNGKTIPIQQSSLQGGSLGSFLAFREQNLQPAQNALGLVALGFASNINRQNQLGQDMNGNSGAALMSIAPPSVSAGAANTGTGSVSATIVNVSAMTASDYQLKYNGTNYTLTRLSDNTVTQLTAAQLTAPGTVVDGVAIALGSGTMNAGDSFLIRPTANAAGSISVTTTDPAKVAAALPFIGTASISATGTIPGSTASKIAGITVNTPTNANLKNPVVITFTDATHYTVTGAVPAVTGTQAYTAPNISYNGWTMQLATGANAPAAGDVFNVGANSGTATVSNGSYNLSPISIHFTSPTAYNVVEMTGMPPQPVTMASNVSYTSGGNISYNGWTTQITGAPAAGDTFNVVQGSSATTMLATPATTNTGSGVISGGALSVQPFTIMFNNPPTSYSVSGATPAAAGSVPYVPGQNISYNGWTIQVSGTPTAGDVFNVAPNTTGTGDNRNSLLMVGLQSQNLMSNGTTTLLGQFNQMVGAVGSKTSELTTTSAAQTTLVAQTVAAQQAVSGVNLDEEAANLLQYQRAYQASAKAMQIANTMFDALLTLR